MDFTRTIIVLIFMLCAGLNGWTQQDTLVQEITEVEDAPQKAQDTTINFLVSPQDAITDTMNKLKNPPVENVFSFTKIFWSLVLILLGYIIIWLMTRILTRFAEQSTRHRISIKRLIPILKVIGWVIIIYTIIEGIINPPLATVIAFFTSVGVAVGIAAQDLLKNIFGGFVILFDRPFELGDKVEYGGQYGEVIKIGLQSTRIVTADDSTVSIPNMEIIKGFVSNANSGETNCQVVAEFYLPEDIDTNRVRQIALEAARVSRFIYLNKPISVLFFHEAKEHRTYLKMRLKAYVSDIRHEFAFKSDMTEIVIRELYEEGVLESPDDQKPRVDD